MKKFRSLLSCEPAGVSRPPAPAGLPTLPGFSELTQAAVITPHAHETMEDLRVSLGASWTGQTPGAFRERAGQPPRISNLRSTQAALHSDV